MRTRLSKDDRRNDILTRARQLFATLGFADTEMEDIRLACGISRGGLYHHFSNKRAVLEALVEGEITSLAELLTPKDTSPIPALLLAGSSNLGGGQGIALSLKTQAEKREYLSALELAFSSVLSEVLSERLQGHVRHDTNPAHVAELFLTINAHINRREILGHWNSAESAGFAATSLAALAPLLKHPMELDPIILELRKKEGSAP